MSAISETNCFYHSERTAMGNCTECRQPICLGCETQTAGKTVCQQCVGAIRQRIADEMSASAGHAAPPAPPMPPAYAPALHPAESGVYKPFVPALGLKQVFGGFGLGFLAGAAGLAAWAVFVELSRMNIALLAVALGWLIGIATIKGTGNRGGNVVAVMSATLSFFFCGIGFILFLGDGQAWDWIFGLLCLFFGVQQAYKTPLAVE